MISTDNNPKVLLRDSSGYIEGIILEGKGKGKYYSKDRNGNIKEIETVSKELLEIYKQNYANRLKTSYL